jgi:hypothetical protein
MQNNSLYEIDGDVEDNEGQAEGGSVNIMQTANDEYDI